MFCPKCGTQNADGARFCLKCGASLAPDAVKTEPKPEEAKPVPETPAEESKWPKIFWIIAGAGAAVVVFFLPFTKKYPYITAIPRAVLGLIAFIDAIRGLVADITLAAEGYLYKPGLVFPIDILWLFAGILFLLAGAACLLAILFRDKLKGKEKIAVLVLGGASVVVILFGLLASFLEIILGITLSFASTLSFLADVLFHAALLGAMLSVLYVNLDQFGMEPKDLKNLFKKEEIKEEIAGE